MGSNIRRYARRLSSMGVGKLHFAAFETTPGGGICHLLLYLWGKWKGGNV